MEALESIEEEIMNLPKLVNLSTIEVVALTEFKDKVQKQLKGNLLSVRLFGSRARGEGDENSDLDVAIIVRKDDRMLKKQVYDYAAEIFLDKEVDISPIILSKSKFNWLKSIERGIALDIEQEGIEL